MLCISTSTVYLYKIYLKQMSIRHTAIEMIGYKSTSQKDYSNGDKNIWL